MLNRYNFIIAISLALFVIAILSFFLAADRALAAAIDIWKFGDPSKGIDLGAHSSFYFEFFCLLGASLCALVLALIDTAKNNFAKKIATISAIIYFISGAVILLLIVSGAAYLYIGR